MLKKYQTDSHVIYGTLRLEIFIKYPLITRESRLFAEIRVLIIADNSSLNNSCKVFDTDAIIIAESRIILPMINFLFILNNF